MPDQKPARYAIAHGRLGGPLVRISNPATFATRRDLVATVNATLDARGYSRRARRQVDIALIWRDVQRRGGSRPCHSFTIENTLPGSDDYLHFESLPWPDG